MSIVDSTHPDYDALKDYWTKYRYTYGGGSDFIQRYLVKHSIRETDDDFNYRKEMSYCPAHAKASLNEIKNSIFQRFVDISRIGGARNFLSAADGSDPKGIDLHGNTMNSFIGRILLPELLSIGKVGIFIDKPATPLGTRVDQLAVRPYIYHYVAEDIRNWTLDATGKLTSVILMDHTYAQDEFGLPTKELVRYRYMKLAEDESGSYVEVRFFNDVGKSINLTGTESETTYRIDIPEIPFVIAELTASLLTDVADYQIALLNLASSDMSYSLRSNFPFYTEQYDAAMEVSHLLRAQSPDGDGTSTDAQLSRNTHAHIGVSQGRKYGKGLERPAFINPSPDPLRVSMDKQEQLKEEIRRLINLNVAGIEPRQASAESKEIDERGLEAGLSYIGLELEFVERKIAQIWSLYEVTDQTEIKYPERYSIKSDVDRNTEAIAIETSAAMHPSSTYRRIAMKQATIVRIGHKLPAQVLEKILTEIDSAKCIITDAAMLDNDITNGLVSNELASKIRGYPEGEVIKAAGDHVARLSRIAIAQSEGAAAARGVPDAASNPGLAHADKIGQVGRG